MEEPKNVYLNLDRCIGCKACQIACGREHHDLPYIMVEVFDEVNPFPMQCRQCEKAPCKEACPVDAIEKTEEGIILINDMKCIGCKICMIACPFGILQLDLAHHVVLKCDMCIDRQKEGKKPICVITCPSEALKFGTFSEIMKEIRIKEGAALLRGKAELTPAKLLISRKESK
jgi:Fe-S-cluster-containing dehydrogenase component